MSNFHSRIMNIPCDASTWAPMFQAVFKEGFKQAKADAAEIVAEADARIVQVEEALAGLIIVLEQPNYVDFNNRLASHVRVAKRALLNNSK